MQKEGCEEKDAKRRMRTEGCKENDAEVSLFFSI